MCMLIFFNYERHLLHMFVSIYIWDLENIAISICWEKTMLSCIVCMRNHVNLLSLIESATLIDFPLNSHRYPAISRPAIRFKCGDPPCEHLPFATHIIETNLDLPTLKIFLHHIRRISGFIHFVDYHPV